MEIHINKIPHKEQRYDTVGDWWWDGENLEMRISDMKNWKYEFLVAYHEFAEAILCKNRNITQKSVDEFDIEFEKNRANMIREAKSQKPFRSSPSGRKAANQALQRKIDKINSLEPGMDVKAPYMKEHFTATILEKLMANELNINWNDYDKTVNNL